MRAIAVLAVIAYHYSANLLASGFVGVDIFFVISGFVVTRSVVHSQTDSAGHDLLRFWRRRFLRIFPPLAAMVVITSLAAAVFFPPFPDVPYRGNFRTGVAALLGVSNLYLHKLDLNYFQDNANNLFVHTWSLGVEEQFYLSFSLIFIALIGVAVKRAWRRRVRLAAVVGLGVASYAYFLNGAAHRPEETYYFLPYRFWELAIGCALALAPDFRLKGRAEALVIPLQLAAAAALVWSATHPTSADLFPVAAVSVAVIASAALIATGSGQFAVVSKVLAARPFVAVGLVSYSLYLWHWPVLAMARYTVGLSSAAGVGFAAILIVGLSVASYHLVERYWRAPGRRMRAAIPAVGAAGVVTVGFAIGAMLAPGQLYAGTPHNWTSDWQRPAGYRYAGERIDESRCHLGNGAAVPLSIPPACISHAPEWDGAKPQVILLGDSQAGADWEMLAYGREQGAFEFATLVHDGCSIRNPPSEEAPSCALYWERAPSLVENTARRGDIVFVAVNWGEPRGPRDQAAARLGAIGAAADRVGARLVVQTALPHFTRATWLCTREWFRFDYRDCTADRAQMDRERAVVTGLLEGLPPEGAAVHIWDPSALLCSGSACSPLRGDKPLFRDYIHLSSYGARSLGPAFAEFVSGLERG